MDIWPVAFTNHPVRDELLRFLSITLIEPPQVVTNADQYVGFRWFQSENYTNVTTTATEHVNGSSVTLQMDVWGQIKSDSLARVLALGKILLNYSNSIPAGQTPQTATLVVSGGMLQVFGFTNGFLRRGNKFDGFNNQPRKMASLSFSILVLSCRAAHKISPITTVRIDLAFHHR